MTEQEQFEHKQHLIEILCHFMKAIEGVLCPGRDFSDYKKYHESGSELARKYFPGITDDEIKGFENHPHDHYAQLVGCVPTYPWIQGSSHREYFGLLIGRKENE